MSRESNNPYIKVPVIETPLTPEFAEKTWRPIQSVIDILQNHLDAQQISRERKFLNILGVKEEYNPGSIRQEAMYFLMERIFLYPTQEDIVKNAYQQLQGIVERCPALTEVNTKLQELPKKPQVRFTIVNGNEEKRVDYEELRKFGTRWKITGFTVYDEGEGFDKLLLGGLGFGLKDKHLRLRGGIGEGLKVSANRLVNAGAKVNIVSANADEVWQYEAVKGPVLRFERRHGWKRKGGKNGSFTAVDFSPMLTNGSSRRITEQILEAIDPRKGEGLGRYILEYSDAQFAPLRRQVDFSNASEHLKKERIRMADYKIAPTNFPAGRLYERGILIMEDANTLFSYDLPKWSIAGADRKTITESAIRELTAEVIATTNDPKRIKQILNAAFKGKNLPEEVRALGRFVDIEESAREEWMKILKDTFHLRPGVVFCPPEMDPREIRLLKQRGYKLISFPQELYLFTRQIFRDDSIDGERVVSNLIFEENREERREQPKPKEEVPPKDPKLQTLDRAVYSLATTLIDRNILSLYQYHRLIDLTSAFSAGKIGSPGMPFAVSKDGKLLIEKNADINFDSLDTKVALVAIFANVISRSPEYNAGTQQILTNMLGIVLEHEDPTLLKSKLPKLNFSAEQLEKIAESYRDSEKVVELYQRAQEILRGINYASLTKRAVEDTLKKLRSIETFYLNPSLLVDEYMSINGDIFHVENGNLKKMSDRIQRVDTQSRYSASNRNHQTISIPYKIEEGKSIYITVSRDGKKPEEDVYYAISRKNGHIVFQMISKTNSSSTSKKGEVLLGSESYLEGFETVARLTLTGSSSIKVSSRRPVSKDEIVETNEGKDVLEVNIDTNYREKVWSDSKRALLDVIQNHLDAEKGKRPEIIFKVVNVESGRYEVMSVTPEQLKKIGRDWQIVEFTFKDHGSGFPTSFLTNVGMSTKGFDERGRNGEGLKMIMASILRDDLFGEVASRNWKARPQNNPVRVRNYETGDDKTFHTIRYALEWDPKYKPGNNTSYTKIGAVSPISQSQLYLTAQQIQELRNARDKSTWIKWRDIMDERNLGENKVGGINRYTFFNDEKFPTDGVTTIIPDRPKDIYERNLQIPYSNTMGQQLLFGYNIDATIIDTRERNHFSDSKFRKHLINFYTTLTDENLMEFLLRKIIKSRVSYLEAEIISQLDISKMSPKTRIAWTNAFNKATNYGAISIRNVRLKEPLSNNSFISYARDHEEDIYHREFVDLPTGLNQFFYDLRSINTAIKYAKALSDYDIKLGNEEQRLLDNAVQQVANAMVNKLSIILSDPEKLVALAPSGHQQRQLQRRLQQIQNGLPRNSVKIKSPFFEANGLTYAGIEKFELELNINTLNNPQEFISTAAHELLHWITGEHDLTTGFARSFAAFLLA